jgi:hypothetical protein
MCLEIKIAHELVTPPSFPAPELQGAAVKVLDIY